MKEGAEGGGVEAGIFAPAVVAQAELVFLLALVRDAEVELVDGGGEVVRVELDGEEAARLIEGALEIVAGTGAEPGAAEDGAVRAPRVVLGEVLGERGEAGVLADPIREGGVEAGLGVAGAGLGAGAATGAEVVVIFLRQADLAGETVVETAGGGEAGDVGIVGGGVAVGETSVGGGGRGRGG